MWIELINNPKLISYLNRFVVAHNDAIRGQPAILRSYRNFKKPKEQSVQIYARLSSVLVDIYFTVLINYSFRKLAEQLLHLDRTLNL